MTKSDKIGNLSVALVAFNKEARNLAHTAKNPHLNNRYTPLHDIVSEVRPLLAQHGLTVSQMPTSDAHGVGVETMLIHESGEYIANSITMPLVEQKGVNLAQVTGSVITYLRRYSLSAILGITTEDDDDGNAAKPAPPQRAPEVAPEVAELAERMKAALEGLPADVQADIKELGAKAYKANDVLKLQEAIDQAESYKATQAYKDKEPAGVQEELY